MKVREIFPEIFTGVFTDSKNMTKENIVNEVYTFNKNAICYGTIAKSKLFKKNVYTEIKDKYYMKDRDIIISMKKPYKVGTMQYVNFEGRDKLIIPNNFIVLRNINRDYYSYIFITNYLEKIGIQKYVEEHNITGDLHLSDIEDIDIPDIPKEKQMTISPLMNYINERSSYFSVLLDNDEELIKKALYEVIGD